MTYVSKTLRLAHHPSLLLLLPLFHRTHQAPAANHGESCMTKRMLFSRASAEAAICEVSQGQIHSLREIVTEGGIVEIGVPVSI